MPASPTVSEATISRLLGLTRVQDSAFADYARLLPNDNGLKRSADRFNTPAWDYFRWYYANKLWKCLTWKGVRTLKFPPDMWLYQEIIHTHGIEYIIETGTRHGGSALFFTDHVRQVVTIDPNPDWQFDWRKTNKIMPIQMSSTAPGVAAAAIDFTPGKRMLILDSLHSADHVMAELLAFVPLLTPGDYIVVEDTVIDALQIGQNGPLRGIERFLATGQPVKSDALTGQKFGASCAVDGFYIRV